jgi:hypothetical protein
VRGATVTIRMGPHLRNRLLAVATLPILVTLAVAMVVAIMVAPAAKLPLPALLVVPSKSYPGLVDQECRHTRVVARRGVLRCFAIDDGSRGTLGISY